MEPFDNLSVCLIEPSILRENSRIVKEALALAKAGFKVTVIGVSSKGIQIAETKITVHSVQLSSRYPRVLTRLVRNVACLRIAAKENTAYYHAHSSLILMLSTALLAKLKGKVFITNYNDILVKEAPAFEPEYYEQEALWGAPELKEREKRRIETTLSMIPKYAESILDVGCGDGRLTNQLLNRAKRVVGVDTSAEALQYVQTETIRASASELPFPDSSFEGVVATDVLEHLPDDIYARSLSEIRRVAKKWIVVGVPWKQQLSRGLVRCPRCGAAFHVNYHTRAYNIHRLRRLFWPDFRVVRVQYSGEDVAAYTRPLLWVKQHVGGSWAVTHKTVCPVCHAVQLPGPIKERNAVSRACDRIDQFLTLFKRHKKSEVIALYETQ